MLVSFSLMRLSPGDPVTVLLGENATDQQIAAMREQLGLNGTFLEQLAHYVGGLARGDLGKSIVFSTPVTTLIAAAMPVTLSLMLVTIIFTLLLAVPIAVYVGQHPRGKVASVFLVSSSFFVSSPSFFVGPDGAADLRGLARPRAGRGHPGIAARLDPIPVAARRWSSARRSSRSSRAS